MCELFALSFPEPVGPSEYFSRFLEGSASNPDGWGIAWYPDKAVQLCKEPVPGATSELARFIGTSQKVRARLYVGHIRKTNSSVVAHENTHPFHRELFGRDFVFAHNGNVSSLKTIPANRFQPVGGTDSEHAFCLLLSRLEERAQWPGADGDFPWLAKEMTELNRYGKFSCLLSDGDMLICRRDAEGRNGLSFLKSQIGTTSGIVVASESLTDEAWEQFQPGELMVFKQGSLVFSSIGRSRL